MSNKDFLLIFLCLQGGLALAWCWALSQRVMKLEALMSKYFDWNMHDE